LPIEGCSNVFFYAFHCFVVDVLPVTDCLSKKKLNQGQSNIHLLLLVFLQHFCDILECVALGSLGSHNLIAKIAYLFIYLLDFLLELHALFFADTHGCFIKGPLT